MPTHCRDFSGLVELGDYPLHTFQYLLRVGKDRFDDSDQESATETPAEKPQDRDRTTAPRFHAVSSHMPLGQYGRRFQWPSHPTLPFHRSACLPANVGQLVTELEAEVESLLHDVATTLESAGAN